MKGQPFDIQKVIAEHGGKCKTRDGQEVTQLAAFYLDDGQARVYGILNNTVTFWQANGAYADSRGAHPRDLIMPTTVADEAWINIYWHPKGGAQSYIGQGHGRRVDADMEEYGLRGKRTRTHVVHITLHSDGAVEHKVIPTPPTLTQDASPTDMPKFPPYTTRVL